MNIVEIKENEINKAANVLALAFENDPIFNYIFKTPELYHKAAPWLFSTWVRWAVIYGKAWMTEDGKGVVLMRSLENPHMSFLSMVRAGMLPTPFKLGWGAFKRFYFEIVETLDRKHAEIMGKTLHWYGWMIGVRPDSRGTGRFLMNYCFKMADQAGLPIFLETATEHNVSLYNHKEFEMKEKISVGKADFSLYFMVRQAQTLNN